MRSLLLYPLFLISFPVLAQAPESSAENAAFTIGACMNQVVPAYSSVHFYLDDPGSGVHVNDRVQLNSPLTSYGFALALEAGNADKRIYCTSILGMAVGGSSNYQFLEFGSPGIGYEIPIPKIAIRHNKYKLGTHKFFSAENSGRVSLRAEINARYLWFDYNLERIPSGNGNPIMINGMNFSNAAKINSRTSMINLTPALSLSVKVCNSLKLRFQADYNLQLYSYERLVDDSYDSKESHYLKEKEFLTDDAGNAAGHLFKLKPLAFKLMLLYFW